MKRNISVLEGKTYTLKFQAKVEPADAKIYLGLQRSGGDYAGVAKGGMVKISTRLAEVSTRFQRHHHRAGGIPGAGASLPGGPHLLFHGLPVSWKTKPKNSFLRMGRRKKSSRNAVLGLRVLADLVQPCPEKERGSHP